MTAAQPTDRSTSRPTDRPTDRLAEHRPLTSVDVRQTTTTLGLSLTAPPSSRRRASAPGERDLTVLGILAKLRLATAVQLERLCMTDGSPLTRSRRTRALLQRLFERHLVVRLERRVGGKHAGSSGFVYGLSGRGQAALGIGGVHAGKRRRVWDVKPAFLEHLLAVADVYVDLVETSRRGGVELLDFATEPGCWRRFPGSSGEMVTLRPDAFLSLGIGALERSVFLEVDLATESTNTILRKGAAYMRYWRTGLEQAAHDVFPQVSWLTLSERRAHQIAGALTRLPSEAHRLFEVALLEAATQILTSTAQGGSMA